MSEFEPGIERTASKAGKKPKGMTLQEAVDMGEYDPLYLAMFPEWHKLTKIMKWQYVRKAIKNRKAFLLRQWAEIFNMLDFSAKPHLAQALKNIENQQKKVAEDEEKLQLEFSV